MARVRMVNRMTTKPVLPVKEPRNNLTLRNNTVVEDPKPTLVTRTLRNRTVATKTVKKPVVEKPVPKKIFKEFTQKQVYKLPKYLFGCLDSKENGCNEQIKELNQFIRKKYGKEVQTGNNIYDEVLKYVKKTRYMCIKEDTNLGMSSSYLLDEIKNHKNNILVVMDETEKIPHSILTYYYDTKKQVVYIPAFCVNQEESASRGYVLLNILKEACRYAGIKNILLDSVPGAVDFYRAQKFSSKQNFSEPYDKKLLRMTLKDELIPFNSQEKDYKANFNSNISNQSLPKNEKPQSPSPFKVISSVTPRVVNKSISNRSKWNSMSTVTVPNRSSPYSQGKMDILELRVDDTIREFEGTENQSVKNIIDHFENKNKTNNDKTLFDLENNKEYILVDNNLYVSDDTKETPFKSQRRSTRRRRSISTLKRSPISTRTRSAKRRRM
jgi:hypothetical protein